MDGVQVATTVGGYIAAAATGALGWFAGRGKRERESAANNAAIADYRADQTVSDASTAQIKLLMDRVQALETKYSALWDELQAEKQASSKLRERVHQLEGILRQNNIQVPPEVK